MGSGAVVIGDGYGAGYGYGYGSGDGDGYGAGSGYGSGSGSGYGDGYGAGYGYGSGYGDGYGAGNGSGDGDGNGYGSGYGDGYGAGNGSGYGDGYGAGNGSGDGDGNGAGAGYGDEQANRQLFKATAKLWPAVAALSFPNAEQRRILLEIIGTDQLFAQSAGQVIDQDIDKQGNERALLRIACQDTDSGYLQAVRVSCPTTHRVYHLLVPPYVKTCHEAVASTFEVEDYNPIRES